MSYPKGKSKPRIEVLDELRLRAEGFAELTLGLPLYDWQARAVMPIERATIQRQNIAVCTPNGSGKDERIIPSAAFGGCSITPKAGCASRAKATCNSLRKRSRISTGTIASLD